MKIAKMRIPAVGITAMTFALIIAGCSKNENPAESMEQIYKRQGRPVQTRRVEKEDFSVYLKFPGEYKARSQSTAYSKIGDVVRQVNVKVGDTVKRDQVIMLFSQDNANYLQAKIQAENAEKAFQRIQKLFNESGVSKQDYDNAKAQYEVSKESLRSIEEMIQVKAPIDGTVTQINAQVSSNVQPGSALFTVSNKNGYEAEFFVLPNEIADIKVGAKSYIEQNGAVLEGRVAEVSMTMDPKVRAFPVKAYFDGSSQMLVSGMHVDVSVEAYNNSEAIVLNQKEMLRSGDQWSAYVVKNGAATKRNITVGRQSGISYEVTAGIEAGENLITSGAQNVVNGEKVLLEEAD